MLQEHTWRVVNYDTGEILESDSLGVILRAVLVDIKYGENVKKMKLYHIDSPDNDLNLEKYLNQHKRMVGKIELAVISKNIGDIKYFVNLYKSQYK